jgi:predicted ATPase
MHFESEQWRYLAPRAQYPCVVLERGRPWDDYGYKTSFTAYYYSKANEETELGTLKILRRGQKQTEVPGAFELLDEHFCSVGQSLEFYERIRELGLEVAVAILVGLRDIIYTPTLQEAFEKEPGYARSLMRGSSALWAQQTAGSLFGLPSRAVPPPCFTYTRQVEGFVAPHRLEIEFQDQTEWFGRIVVIVGRNGTGKTVLMGLLAHALSGLNEQEVPNLGPARPLVSQVIAVSYSAFDTFTRPYYPYRRVNYVYCGLRDAAGRVDMDLAMKSFDEALQSIREQHREPQWTRLLQESGLLQEFPEPERITQLPLQQEEWLQHQSSGQKVLLLIIARVLANIRQGSILLVDELETHLHPLMLSGMMRLLHLLLLEFRSYAIVATHSPIVLQEIPARDIRILDREGGVPIISRYPSESFGENLTEIVNTAFRVDEQHKNYFHILRQLVEKRGSREQITAVLGKRLSLNARMALHALTVERGAQGDEKP